MAKALNLKDLFIKLSSVFSKDVYIVHHKYVIAGKESDELNRGYYLCIIEPRYEELLKSEYPGKEYLFIKSIKSTKMDFKLVVDIIDIDTIKILKDKITENVDMFNQINNWETFNFTDKEIEAIFTDNKSFILFDNDDSKSSIIISKSLFPLVTSKTLNNLSYVYDKYEKSNELEQLLVNYDFLPFFQLRMRYLFLPI